MTNNGRAIAVGKFSDFSATSSMIFFGTYVLTQPGQNSHKSPNLATLRVIRGFS